MASEKDRYEASRWLSSRFASGKWRGAGITVDLRYVGKVHTVQVYQSGFTETEIHQNGLIVAQVYEYGASAISVYPPATL